MYDLITKAIKNSYGVTSGYIFEAISESGRKYLDKHWSIRDEIVAPCNAEFWLEHMAQNGLKVDLRY